MESGIRTDEQIAVRGLEPRDLDAVIALDARIVGRRRELADRICLDLDLTDLVDD